MKSLGRVSFLKRSLIIICFIYSVYVYYSYKRMKVKFNMMDFTMSNQVPKPKLSKLATLDCSQWDDFITCNKLWRGDALFPFKLPKGIQLTVVISHCSKTIPIQSYMKYIKAPNVAIKNIYIMTCPEASNSHNIKFDMFPYVTPDVTIIGRYHTDYSTDHSIAKWFETNIYKMKSWAGAKAKDKNKNHFILFLNSESIVNFKDLHWIANPYRSLHNVLKATMQYGFGCVSKPMQPHHSLYHSTNVLRSYRGMSSSSINHDQNNSTFSNFGDWLDEVKISLETYTPVCYTSSFAIRVSDVFAKEDKLLSISNNLANHNNNEVHGFAERTWGGLFSYPLKKNLFPALLNHTYKILRDETCGLTGSLISDYTKPITSELWKGENFTEINLLDTRISVVVSYCKEGLEWVDNFINGTSIHDLTILNKCDQELKNLTYSNVTISQMSMPKSRRLYHPFARFMHQLTDITKDGAENENHIIVFLSAAKIPSKSKTLQEMVTTAVNTGFACSRKPPGKLSIYYETNKLRQSSPKDASMTFDQWLDTNNIKLPPNPITPYCYSNHFAAKVSNIRKHKETWEKLQKLETYGVNANFVRKTWTGLLFDPLTNEQLDYFRNSATDTTDGGILTYDF